MIELTLAEVAAVIGGVLADVPAGAVPLVTGPVVVDSRAVTAGALFVAIPGERVDGHEFATAAVQAGAVGAMTTRPVGVPAVVVGDTVSALGALAGAVAARLPATVVGVTGSSGKTSTKDLLASVLGRIGATVAPVGSQNNEIGHPLTVLRADLDTRFLVLEMSARGLGHIAYLARIAPPRVGVVLNVGSAHVGEFGSREVTAQAKGELVEALPAAADGGVAVLNADDPLVLAMATRTRARVLTVGRSAGADVRAEGVTLDAHGRAAFVLVTAGGKAPVRLRLVGEHHVGNALAVAAVALTVGADPGADLGAGVGAGVGTVAAVAAALSTAEPASRWRMEVTERSDGVTIVNDAYNANPESVRAALKALVAIGVGGRTDSVAVDSPVQPAEGGSRAAGPVRRRTWAVLGEMGELGAASGDEHDAVGRLAVRLDVSRLVAVGDGARRVHAGAVLEGSWSEESAWVPDADAALALLREQLRPGDVVLVKASRAVGLERVAIALAADA